MEMFNQCYQLEASGFGAVYFNRIALPRRGGVWDQDAREMEALDVLHATATAVLNEQFRERESRKKRERGNRRG